MWIWNLKYSTSSPVNSHLSVNRMFWNYIPNHSMQLERLCVSVKYMYLLKRTEIKWANYGNRLHKYDFNRSDLCFLPFFQCLIVFKFISKKKIYREMKSHVCLNHANWSFSSAVCAEKLQTLFKKKLIHSRLL